MNIRSRIILILLMIGVSVSIYAAYPIAKTLLVKGYSIPYAQYDPPQGLEVNTDAASGSPALGVPLLMYHGVVDDVDGINTTKGVFVRQMEALKSAGYETISIADLDHFYQGTRELPPKPIIITFDDGRKDSYYPVDDLLKDLGFKATIFVATSKALASDSFYLSWEELAQMRDSGRWEIEAHGRNSHADIVNDASGSKGRYLASLKYLPGKGLETVAEYEARVEQDYKDGIKDLKDHLGIDPLYFAVPLNTYGANLNSNYEGALAFNQAMTKKYFRMAFVETIVYDRADDAKYRNTSNRFSVYNFPDEDPYTIRRMEVKNMSPRLLLNILDREAPSQIANLEIAEGNTDLWENMANLRYGEMSVLSDGLHLRAFPQEESAKVWFGNAGWSNYTVEAHVARSSGRSVMVLGLVKDNLNAIAAGFTDNSFYVRKIENDEKTELTEPMLMGFENGAMHDIIMTFRGGSVTVSLDGTEIVRNVTVPLIRGQAGMFVWGDGEEKAEGVITSLKVYPAQPM